jgi:thiol:disulfide interchange protein DsbD
MWLTTLTICAALAAAAPPEVESGKSIDFISSLEAAQVIADGASKPIVVQFGAEWCTYCRKMHRDTFRDPRVLEFADTFIWVDVDIDLQPGLAARFGVRGVPQTTILDRDGATLASVSGFHDGVQLAELLGDAVNAAARRAGERPAAPSSDPELFRKAVVAQVELIASPSRGGRDGLIRGIARMGEPAIDALLDMLDDERLSVRAAAAYALREVTLLEVDFDAFAEVEVRRTQAAEWTRAIAERRVPSVQA